MKCISPELCNATLLTWENYYTPSGKLMLVTGCECVANIKGATDPITDWSGALAILHGDPARIVSCQYDCPEARLAFAAFLASLNGEG